MGVAHPWFEVGDRVRFVRPGSPLGPAFGTVAAVVA